MMFLFIRSSEFTGKCEKHQAKHIESCHQRSERCNRPQNFIVLKRSSKNFIFRKETGERKYTGDSKRRNKECPESKRHPFFQTTHVSNVLLTVQCVNHGTRTKE